LFQEMRQDGRTKGEDAEIMTVEDALMALKKFKKVTLESAESCDAIHKKYHPDEPTSKQAKVLRKEASLIQAIIDTLKEPKKKSKKEKK